MTYVYRPKLTEEDRASLSGLARDMGYFVEQKGRHFGEPSPPALLDALADAYRRDPTAVVDALAAVGVGAPTGDGREAD